MKERKYNYEDDFSISWNWKLRYDIADLIVILFVFFLIIFSLYYLL